MTDRMMDGAFDKGDVMESSVFEAISAAAKEIKRLPKESRNTEHKYDFASVDDFFAMTGPICAKHGLTIIVDECGVQDLERAGKYGVTQWSRYSFRFTIFDRRGDKTPTVGRSVEVVRLGAQSAGSAQSYALKQFLRSTFQIPTGDDDDPDNGNDAGSDQSAARHPTAAKADDAAFNARILKAKDDIAKAGSLDELTVVWRAINAVDRAVAADAGVIRAKDQRKAALLGGLDDEIPY